MIFDTAQFDEYMANAMAIAANPPAIVEPYFQPDSSYQDLIKMVDGMVAKARANYLDWEKRGHEQRETLGKVLEHNSHYLDQNHIDQFRNLADFLETQANEKVSQYNRAQKDMKRTILDFEQKRGAKFSDPVRQAFEKLNKQFQSEIDVLLESALFFRALAGKYDPSKTIVASASDSKGLKEVFNSWQSS